MLEKIRDVVNENTFIMTIKKFVYIELIGAFEPWS